MYGTVFRLSLRRWPLKSELERLRSRWRLNAFSRDSSISIALHRDLVTAS
jgi:hypothetical protein